MLHAAPAATAASQMRGSRLRPRGVRTGAASASPCLSLSGYCSCRRVGSGELANPSDGAISRCAFSGRVIRSRSQRLGLGDTGPFAHRSKPPVCSTFIAAAVEQHLEGARKPGLTLIVPRDCREVRAQQMSYSPSNWVGSDVSSARIRARSGEWSATRAPPTPERKTKAQPSELTSSPR